MEETFEKESLPVEEKAPDEDQGGIGRRLRDRDLLRKRKAEAEEKATNQWVYGAQSRKRARKEPSSTAGKKGRPRKNAVPVEPQPEPEPEPEPVVLQTSEQPEILRTPEEVPAVQIPLLDPVPAPAPVLQLIPLPEPVPVTPPKPAEPLIIPVPEEVPSDSGAGILIEDLGPDEDEDKPVSQERLIIDQGAVEEPAAALPEQTKIFSEPVLATPIAPPTVPTQQDYLPGNLL
ncbi:hemogen [Astyanax mexicanus]|uniref:Hemogen n=1 Tax=Astyanax mexicanus TaxID=7994 RepID=A0A8T2LXU9_ASTMX|nr:hemogen [Astyanax mexicanus]